MFLVQSSKFKIQKIFQISLISYIRVSTSQIVNHQSAIFFATKALGHEGNMLSVFAFFHHSLFLVHHSLFLVQSLRFKVPCSTFLVQHSLFFVPCSKFKVQKILQISPISYIRVPTSQIVNQHSAICNRFKVVVQ